MAGIWRVHLLGGLRVEGRGAVLTRFHTYHAAALLAWLAYHPGRLHPREVVFEMLWPGVEPGKGRNRLNVALASLRRQLEPPGVAAGSVVVTDRLQVGLAEGAVETDVARFEAAARTALAGADGQTAALEAAAGLYAGPLLPGYYLEWVAPAAERLADLHWQVSERLAGQHLAAGRSAEALAAARRALEADPQREDAHELVLRIAAATGDVGLARRQYDELAAMLGRELDAEPSEGARRLLAAAERSAPGRTEPLPAVTSAPPAPARHGGTRTVVAVAGRARRNVAELCQAHGGRLVACGPLSAEAEFAAVGQALRAALDLADEPVCVGLHTTEAGPGAEQTARALAAAGHAGQVLLSESAALLARRDRLAASGPVELGRFRLHQRPERVFQADARTYPALRLERATLGSVPPASTRFFGREDEQRALAALLAAPPPALVTLTGPGGGGKTRLALELARTWLEQRAESAWFVPLAAVTTPGVLAHEVLASVSPGAPAGPEPLERLVWLLREDPGLLVLDNLEQLGDGVAAFVALLLARVPGLRCLATSRRRLGVDGEQEYPLAPLPVPGDEADPEQLLASPSVAMFVDRARAALPAFALTVRNARDVAAICRRLEGLPLALEVAAPRVQQMPLHTLLARLGERLDWAASARSGLPPRQRSLRATLAWSYELLPDGLRRFLRRLSIFRGAFCAQGAAAVTGEELAGELLVHLRGYSLVGRVTDDRGHGFVLLETVREFLAQQLEPDEAPGLAERHARWYLSLVSTPAPDPLETAWRQERAVANIRVALAWALANDTEAALVAATALDPFWELRGNHVEGCGWLVAALAAAPHAPAALRGAAASVYGRLACYALPQDRAQAVLEQAVADLRAADAPVVARFQALLFLCIVATARDDAAAVDAAHAEAAALAAADGSPVARFFLLNTVYHQALLRRDYDAALAALRANSEVVASLGDPVLTLRHLAQQAFVEVACGELAAAEATLAAIPAEPLGSVRGVWTLQAAFAEVRLRYRQGRRAESVALLAAVADQIAGSVPVHAHHAAEFVSQVLSDRGRHNDALAWLEVGARWRAQWGVVYDFALDADDRARIRAAAEAALSPAQAQAATASGLGWTTETLAEALRELPEVAAAATSAGPRVAMLG